MEGDRLLVDGADLGFCPSGRRESDPHDQLGRLELIIELRPRLTLKASRLGLGHERSRCYD